MVNAFEHNPPAIPDLKVLWAEWDDASSKDSPKSSSPVTENITKASMKASEEGTKGTE
jgi:hypothetical protein